MTEQQHYTLSDIGATFGFTVSGNLTDSLDVEPVLKERRSSLFTEDQVWQIRDRLVRRLNAVDEIVEAEPKSRAPVKKTAPKKKKNMKRGKPSIDLDDLDDLPSSKPSIDLDDL